MTDTPRINCTHCGSVVEAEPDSDHVTCARCGTSYDVQELHGIISFIPTEMSFPDAGAAKEAVEIIEARIAEIEETLEETHSEIDALRARELSGPLQLGCTFFGVFVTMLAVIAVFMLLGKSYFGGWMFYLSLAIVVALGLSRIRHKLGNRVPVEQLQRERIQLEESLAQLQAESDRLRKLRRKLPAQDPSSERGPAV